MSYPNGYDEYDTEVLWKKLWGAGGAVAIVLAICAVLGNLVLQGWFGVAPVSALHTTVPVTNPTYVPFGAALAALLATALLHLGMVTAGRSAVMLFRAIVAVFTVALVVAVCLNSGDQARLIGTSAMYGVMGLFVATLLGRAGQMCLVTKRPARPGPPGRTRQLPDYDPGWEPRSSASRTPYRY